MAILGSMPSSSAFAFAYRPISSPARRLSVAKSASAADSGSVGVSRAITVTPASRAFSIAGTTAAEFAGVMRMPFAPRSVMSSSAATWLSLSTSLFPAATRSWTFSSPAVFFAVSSIFTKNGFVSCLMMSPAVICSSSSPHAATPRPSMAAPASASRPHGPHQCAPSTTSGPPSRSVRRSNSA